MRLFKRRKTNHRKSTTPAPSLTERLPDVDPAIHKTIEEVQPFTMTSPERIAALCDAVQHIVRNSVEGSIVECGVWKGGSMLAAIKTLQSEKSTNRALWLYDTFDGMTEPTSNDVDFLGRNAKSLLDAGSREDPSSIWCRTQLQQVKSLINGSKYPGELVNYVVGPVEQTIPGAIPDKIALLRLDTDWYESTRHELIHLMPKLVPGGVLIIDDYGHWEGCRRAVDEYFIEHNVTMLLNRIDYTGRIGIHVPEASILNLPKPMSRSVA